MEKSDKETHDFMNVESFSQLPFIRPSSIRLFGKEFGSDSSSLVIINDESDSNDNTTIGVTAAAVREESKESGESNRKFECHYCCRNFPTSQALGGHQNAHKRERQHAKRAHLNSSMFHVTNGFTEAQMYGLMNYHRLSPTVPPYYHHQQQPPPPPPPPSWRTSTTSSLYSTSSNLYSTSSNYGISSSSYQTPINGSPLATLRIPAARNLAFSDRVAASRIGSSTVSNSQIRYSYEPKTSVQDQVSLDLHL